MTPEEMKVLADKLNDGTSTQEEELALLQELNKGIDELKSFVKMVASENSTAEDK